MTMVKQGTLDIIKGYKSKKYSIFHYLINSIVVDGGIKCCVEIIEEVHNFKWCGVCRDGGEANNVREIDGHFLKLFRSHRHPQL